jgi:hypothetical protein
MKRVLFLLLLIPFLAAQITTEVEITFEPSHHLAVDNEDIRAFQVEIAPHTATLMHRHRHDYIYVTIGDAHISNGQSFPAQTRIGVGELDLDRRLTLDFGKFNSGDAKWLPGGYTHTLTNVGKSPARLVTVEF